jgi:hypothetical protein
MPQPKQPPLVADRFVLILDGTVCGFVSSAAGGDVSAPVIREPIGSTVKKRLGAPVSAPIELTFGLALHKVVYEWIGEFWKGDARVKGGSVITLDANDQARSELVFEKATIAATTIPAANASSNAASFLTVRLAPAKTRRRPVSGPAPGLAAALQKSWLASSFRLEIGGLDATGVSSVDPLTIAATREGVIDFPDLRVLLAESTARSWSDWHEEFVVKGRNDDSKERPGALVFLHPDGHTELGRLALSGLGIYRLAPAQASEAGQDRIRRLAAELYCERMELVIS